MYQECFMNYLQAYAIPPTASYGLGLFSLFRDTIAIVTKLYAIVLQYSYRDTIARVKLSPIVNPKYDVSEDGITARKELVGGAVALRLEHRTLNQGNPGSNSCCRVEARAILFTPRSVR